MDEIVFVEPSPELSEAIARQIERWAAVLEVLKDR